MVNFTQIKNVILISVLSSIFNNSSSLVFSFTVRNHPISLHQQTCLGRTNLPSTNVATVIVGSGLKDDEEVTNQSELLPIDRDTESGNFDGSGFANYLGPYILAFLGSIAVTAGFFKFVLLDN